MEVGPIQEDRLARWITGRTRHCSEMERLDLAVKVSMHLAQVGDELLSRYVNEARAAGASWTDIGSRLGVTRQAAQQRHGGRTREVAQGSQAGRVRLFGARRARAGGAEGPFANFDDAARGVFVLAQEEAGELGHECVGTEHLLLALSGWPDPACDLVRAAGLTPDAVRQQMVMMVGTSAKPGGRPRRLTPLTKRAFEGALRLAGHRGADRVAPSDLLVAVLELREGLGAELAEALDADPSALAGRLRQAAGMA